MNNKIYTAAAVAMLALLPSFAMAVEQAPADDKIPQEAFVTISPENFVMPGEQEQSIASFLAQRPELAEMKEIPASIWNQLKPSDFEPR